MEKHSAPIIEGALRHGILKMPKAAYEASGIIVNGRRLKTFVFTTDLAIIRNCDADAVFAVYPFTPQQAISDAIIKASYIPVFCGVGGGVTKGIRTVSLAKDVECQGAMGVVLNAPITNLNLACCGSRHPRSCHSCSGGRGYSRTIDGRCIHPKRRRRIENR